VQTEEWVELMFRGMPAGRLLIRSHYHPEPMIAVGEQ
jgi:hypothetical protein